VPWGVRFQQLRHRYLKRLPAKANAAGQNRRVTLSSTNLPVIVHVAYIRMRVRPWLLMPKLLTLCLLLSEAGTAFGSYPMESAGTAVTILLVDDNETVRRFVRQLLIEQGFHVIQASDGAEALEIASEYPGLINLLVTDVMMPKVTGLVLAGRLLQERPGIGVLYMSGYIEGSILQTKYPESTILQKPFTPAQLIAAVRQVLASKEGQ